MGQPAPPELLERMRADPALSRVADALAQQRDAWLVGGAVRDLLLGLSPTDIDVVVEGDGVAAAGGAARRLDGSVVAHERFGTATVMAADLRFDVATARRERYPAPGALPVVEAGSLEEDLARRDFSVHALALGLASGALREFPGGLEDLRRRRLRVLHERSFLDDPTRLLRLVRYTERLGFAMEERTRELALEAVAGGAVATVSGARVGAELRLLLREKAALAALKRMSALGLDSALHPALSVDARMAGRALERAPSDARPHLVLLAACAVGFRPDELRAWLTDLEFTTGEREAVVAAATGGAQLAAGLAGAARPSQIAALARRRPPEQLALAAALAAPGPVERWERELRHVQLEISGADLVAAGVPEGPAIGRGLAAALAAKLDGIASGREAELRAAMEAAGA